MPLNYSLESIKSKKWMEIKFTFLLIKCVQALCLGWFLSSLLLSVTIF